MTAVTRDANGKINEIPSDLTTVEQIFAWCGQVLEFNSGSDSYRETIAGNEYFTSIRTGKALDETNRIIYRISLERTSDYPTRPTWKAVEELKQGTIPASYQLPE